MQSNNTSPRQNADEQQKAVLPVNSWYTFTPKARPKNSIFYSVKEEFIGLSFLFSYNSKESDIAQDPYK